MNGSHPDLAALEALRTGEAAPAEAAHVAGCPDCRAAVEDLRDLAGRLAHLPTPRLDVPVSVKAQVLSRVRRGIFLRRIASAAAVLLAGAILWSATRATPQPDDLDRSGRVDILDAYLLARRIQTGGSLDPSWDLNGDGVVDRRDVDEIARRSVALGRRGS